MPTVPNKIIAKQFCWLILLAPLSIAQEVFVGEFSKNSLSNWEEKVFNQQTHYRLQPHQETHVLTANSSSAASGLFKNININLDETPYIHWSWKIKHTLKPDNERNKAGDDFSARIYIIFSDGPFFWQTKTLSYTWANQASIGDHWPNPYTSNAQLLSIETGNTYANQWRLESRHVADDIRRVFGKRIQRIEAIAIMTDTDQTGAVTQAWFGDIWFSDKPR